MRKIILIFSAAVCCTMMMQSCVKDKKDEVKEYVNVGDGVPEFTVQGKTFTVSDFAGKSSLIVFFTAECPHCKTLMPVVDDAWREIIDDADYQIIAIARESSGKDVQSLWDGNQMIMPYFLDPNRSAFNKFANMNVPRLYLVDENGIITWRQTGEAGITKQFLLSLMGLLR